MQPNKTIAGNNGCERLNEKIAFPFGCALSNTTMTSKPTIKIELKIQKIVVETVIVSDVTSLTKIVNVTAKQPANQMKIPNGEIQQLQQKWQV